MTEPYEWYPPSAIRYTKPQILWLLVNVLDAAVWSSEHKESGYAGGPKTRSNHHAHYESLKMISGELSGRLVTTGLDGLALEFVIRLSDGDDTYLKQRVANYQRRSYGQVSEGIKLALRYCTGFRRRKVSYRDFCYYTREREAQRKRGNLIDSP